MRFTKASKGDGFKTTTTVNGLYEWLLTTNLTPLAIAKLMAHTRYQGNQFIYTVGGVPTLFTVNRAGKTLATNTFPGKLTRPSVGRAVNHPVTNVTVILSTSGTSGKAG